MNEVVSQMHAVFPLDGVTPSIAKRRRRGKPLFSSAKHIRRARMRNAETNRMWFANLDGTVKSLTSQFAKLPVEIVQNQVVEQEVILPSHSKYETELQLSVDFIIVEDSQVFDCLHLIDVAFDMGPFMIEVLLLGV